MVFIKMVLKDPMGIPFIDDKLISNAKEAWKKQVWNCLYMI